MIAFTSGAVWTSTWLRMLPTGAILACGNLALGLLAVVVLDARPWVLPALLVPVALLWSASRQNVQAQIDRERTAGERDHPRDRAGVDQQERAHSQGHRGDRGRLQRRTQRQCAGARRQGLDDERRDRRSGRPGRCAGPHRRRCQRRAW